MGSRLAAAAVCVAGLVASATVIGPAAAAPYDPPPRVADPPAANTFPVPLPYRASFGDDWHACRDGCSRRHKGNDIFAAEGTPEVAVESGVIAKVDRTDDGLGGLTIWLRGDSGVAYYYAHNSANLVVEGQRVARGQVIGRVGHTGNARTTPSHVHFQINVCGELSSDEPCTVNPRPHLLAWPQGLVDGGADGLGWYRPSDATFRLRNDAGSALPALGAGRRGSGDLPVAGDWDGDGRDTLGLYRRSRGLVRLLDDAGSVVGRIRLGGAGRADTFPVAGDWNGDGHDTIGVYQRAAGAFLLGDESGHVTRVVVGPAGRTDTLPVAGDWNADGRDTVGVYQRAAGAFLLGDESGRVARVAFGPARRTDTLPVAGDWDGDGRDTVGVYRRASSRFVLDAVNDGSAGAGAADGAPVVAETVSAGGQEPGPTRAGGPLSVAFGRPGQAGVLPVAGDWNGRDLVTLDDLRQIYGPLRNTDEIARSLPMLNAAMLQAGAATPARKAAFLATLRNESGFRADAVEPGRGRYRGRGFIQLTGVSNYRRAGQDLGLDLVEEPSLAANPLVSAAVAAWYWTVARDINRAADWLDMAAVDIAVGYRRSDREDAERCLDFTVALSYFSGGELPDGVNCERTILSQLLGLAAVVAPAVAAEDSGGSGPTGPAQRTTVPWPLEAVVPTPPSPRHTPDRPPSTRPPSTRPPSTRPPTTTPPPTHPPTTRPPTTGSPTTTTTTTTAPPTSTTTTTTPPATDPTTTTTTTTTTTAPPTTTTTTAPPSTEAPTTTEPTTTAPATEPPTTTTATATASTPPPP